MPDILTGNSPRTGMNDMKEEIMKNQNQKKTRGLVIGNTRHPLFLMDFPRPGCVQGYPVSGPGKRSPEIPVQWSCTIYFAVLIRASYI